MDGREPGRANPLQARTAESGLTSSSGCRFPGSASTFFMAVIDWRDYVDEETKKPPRPYALAAQVESQSHELTELTLNGLLLGESGASALVTALHARHGSERLRTLKASGCALGSRGATLVAALLAPRFSGDRLGLRMVDLSNNHVGADGARAIAVALEAHVSGPALADAGAEFQLSLSRNPIVARPPHEGVAALRRVADALAALCGRWDGSRAFVGLAQVGPPRRGGPLLARRR